MTTKFKPMLAENIKPEQMTQPSYGSLKLEGVRFVIHPDEGLIGRSLKPFNNQLLYEREDIKQIEQYCAENSIILEGEFYVHGWTFNKIDSAIRGNGNIDANELELHVFDCYVPKQPTCTFHVRYAFYKYAVNELVSAGVKKLHYVEQTLMKSAEDVRSAYCWAIENGYEGFVLKARDGYYKMGRSTLKQQLFTRIKPEETYDCVVLDIIERQENLCESEVNELGYLKKRQDKDQKRATGMAQTALVYTPQFGEIHKVSLTRGLTDPDRMLIWENADNYKGKCMQFVGIPVPGQNISRSPRFDKWRHDIEPAFIQHSESNSLLVEWDAKEIQDSLDAGCDLINFELFKTHLEDGWDLSNKS